MREPVIDRDLIAQLLEDLLERLSSPFQSYLVSFRTKSGLEITAIEVEAQIAALRAPAPPEDWQPLHGLIAEWRHEEAQIVADLGHESGTSLRLARCANELLAMIAARAPQNDAQAPT